MKPVIDLFKQQDKSEPVCRNCRKKWWQCLDKILWPLKEHYLGITLVQCDRFDATEWEVRYTRAMQQITWMKRELNHLQKSMFEKRQAMEVRSGKNKQ